MEDKEFPKTAREKANFQDFSIYFNNDNSIPLLTLLVQFFFCTVVLFASSRITHWYTHEKKKDEKADKRGSSEQKKEFLMIFHWIKYSVFVPSPHTITYYPIFLMKQITCEIGHIRMYLGGKYLKLLNECWTWEAFKIMQTCPILFQFTHISYSSIDFFV